MFLVKDIVSENYKKDYDDQPFVYKPEVILGECLVQVSGEYASFDELYFDICLIKDIHPKHIEIGYEFLNVTLDWDDAKIDATPLEEIIKATNKVIESPEFKDPHFDTKWINCMLVKPKSKELPSDTIEIFTNYDVYYNLSTTNTIINVKG